MVHGTITNKCLICSKEIKTYKSQNHKTCSRKCEGLRRKKTHCKNGHLLEETRIISKSGKNVTCKICEHTRQNSPKYIKKRKRRYTNKYKYSKYGISKSTFYSILKEQNKKCKICEIELSNFNTHIDHCHKTNKFRGILCSLCNIGLGHFKDNYKYLLNAAKYINNFNKEYKMPSKSKPQHDLMEAVSNNPKFAKKAGIPQKVGKDFAKADKANNKFNKGGPSRPMKKPRGRG